MVGLGVDNVIGLAQGPPLVDAGTALVLNFEAKDGEHIGWGHALGATSEKSFVLGPQVLSQASVKSQLFSRGAGDIALHM